VLYSRRRRRARRRLLAAGGLVVVVLAAAGGWWYFRDDESASTSTGNPLETVSNAAAAVVEPEVAIEPVRPDEEVIIQGDTPVAKEADASLDAQAPEAPAEDPVTARVIDDTSTGNATITAARKLHGVGKLLEARQQLSRLLAHGLTGAEDAEARALLTRIADETVFGRRVLPGDPLADRYTIQSGERLINIGKQHAVPYDILKTINGIRDETKIRANQRIKVLRGPFHVKIYKSKFRMDVYLGEQYVRSYRVGLGTDNGTPGGVWRVKNRLKDPTYYPPASAVNKRIIAPGDPTNPLGRRWIGLEGVEGAAVGHEGYGIHGTIEPESIGKDVSLGCIRMHNEDVAFVYQLLMPGRSTVTILP